MSCAVRCVSIEDLMTISFTHEGKQRNLKRSKVETLEKSLARIAISFQNVNKKSKKEKKEKNLSLQDIPSASLWFCGERVKTDVLNIEAWKDGSEIRIGERCIKVELNPPTVTSLSLPSHIMAEFPIFPLLELQFAVVNNCLFTWFRSKNPVGNSASPSVVEECEWEIVGSEFFYKPTLLDIGCYLKLVCTAARADRKSSIQTDVTSSVEVSAGPGVCPFENRHLYTSKRAANKSFRLVTYNILADVYARDDFALNVLYPYCPPYGLNIGYRKQLLLKELAGYNADIICLQECGLKLFDNFLQPSMEMLGYQGLLKCKAGEVPEGEATFFNTSKFEFMSSHDLVIKESLVQDPLHEAILGHVSSIPAFLENVINRNAVAQITVLQDKDQLNSYLCIANTHLYYKPHSPHVRLVQAAVILNAIEKVVNDLSSSCSVNTRESSQTYTMTGDQTKCAAHEVNKIAVIFCGDFNSVPRNALVQLLTEGHVDAGHRDWTVTENEDEHCKTINLSQSFRFTSACGFPAFTNYTGGFKDTLDYIFCGGQHLEVEAVIPISSEEELSLYGALPSVVMPSDHIALVCDLKWKT